MPSSIRLDVRPSVNVGCRELLLHLDWDTMPCCTSTFSMSPAQEPYSYPSPVNPSLVQLSPPMSSSLHTEASCFPETSWTHMLHHRATRAFLELFFHRRCCLFPFFKESCNDIVTGKQISQIGNNPDGNFCVANGCPTGWPGDQVQCSPREKYWCNQRELKKTACLQDIFCSSQNKTCTTSSFNSHFPLDFFWNGMFCVKDLVDIKRKLKCITESGTVCQCREGWT